MGEIIAFAPYFEWELGLPCSNFFSRLLYYYGIQLHHLTPNFLFIFPSSCTCAKLFWASSPILSFSAISSTSNHNQIPKNAMLLEVRVFSLGIPYKLSSKVIDWKPKWFYIENHGSTLPMIALGPLVIRPEWKKKPLDTSQTSDLLKLIVNLKQNQITEEAVAFY